MPIPRTSPQFHESDVGTILIFEIRNGKNKRVDISNYSALEVFFMRPDGSTFSRPALPFPALDSNNPDGFDGQAFYITQPGDLVPAGEWYMQFFADCNGGAWYSSIISFIVHANLVSLAEVLTP
jgi:hypothetical protein